MLLAMLLAFGAVLHCVTADYADVASVECGSPSNPPLITQPEEGNLTSPYYPGNYPNNLLCGWRLSAGSGKVVGIRFNDFCTEECCDHVQIYNGPTSGYSLLLQHSGCSIPTTLEANSGQAYVQFRTDSSVVYRGFHLTWEFRHACGSVNSPPVISQPYVGHLASPNYASNYNHNLYCGWQLNAGSGEIVRILFNDFCTETSHDYVQIFNGPTTGSPVLLHHSGCSLPSVTETTSSQAFVLFRTDGSVSYRGFHFTYEFLPGTVTTTAPLTVAPTGPPIDCGTPTDPIVIQSEPTGSLTSPSPYSTYANCGWLFNAENELGVHLRFSEFCTRQCCDFVRVYDGTSIYHRLIGEHSGCQLPPDVTSSGSYLLLTLTSTDGQERGFKLSWDMTLPGECGDVSDPVLLTQSSGRLTSPSYPSSYLNNQNCAWLILAGDQQGVSVTFHDFCTEQCCDHVRLYDGNTTSHRQLLEHSGCSVPQPVISSGRNLLITFTTDASQRERGFNMSWIFSNATCGNPESPLIISQPSPGHLTSPNYPDNYANNLACSWVLIAPVNQVVSVEIHDVCTESCCDRLTFFDGNTTDVNDRIYEHAGCHEPSPSDIVSSRNSLLITFTTDSSVTLRGFRLTWEFTDSVCGTPSSPFEVDGSEGVITSPNYPSKYPHGLQCVWQLNAETDEVIAAHFTNLCTEECCDVITFFEAHNRSEDTQLARRSGCSLGWDIASNGREMSITFTTDDNINLQGFSLNWESTLSACGHPNVPIHLPEGQNGSFATPNYPDDHPRNMECGWLIRGGSGQTVEIWFEDFCTNGQVTGYDGESPNNEILFDFTGCMHPPPAGIFSSGNAVLVTFKTEEAATTDRGFHLGYEFYSSKEN